MNICVFSSSSNAIPDIYFREAGKLGKLIGEGGHTLVNGGANVGLMEAITVAAREAGANTIGVIPEKLKRFSLASANSQEIIVTKDMQGRKSKMREISDAFVAMPGSFGTLEEILEVMTLRQLSYHKKPIVFLNTNCFYRYLFKQFETSYSEMFAKEAYRKLFHIAQTPEGTMEYLAKYKPAELDSKWFSVPIKKDQR